MKETPKIIHQIWYQGGIPKKYEKSVYSWITKNPSWKYVLWNKESARRLIPKFFIETYDSFPYDIQRIDAMRYFFLYLYGGVYVDMDVNCEKPLDGILEKNKLSFAPSAIRESSLSNWMIHSPKGHPFWPKMWAAMIKSRNFPSFLGKHLVVMNTTGAALLTRTLKSTKTEYRILPRRKMIPCSICEPIPCKKPNPEAVVSFTKGQTWNKLDTFLINWFWCSRKGLIVFLLSLAIVVVLFLKNYVLCSCRSKV